MPNYKIIDGKRENSKYYVSEGFIYTKNNQDTLKIRLRCHRWRDECKGTAHFFTITYQSCKNVTMGRKSRR